MGHRTNSATLHSYGAGLAETLRESNLQRKVKALVRYDGHYTGLRRFLCREYYFQLHLASFLKGRLAIIIILRI